MEEYLASLGPTWLPTWLSVGSLSRTLLLEKTDQCHFLPSGFSICSIPHAPRTLGARRKESLCLCRCGWVLGPHSAPSGYISVSPYLYLSVCYISQIFWESLDPHDFLPLGSSLGDRGAPCGMGRDRPSLPTSLGLFTLAGQSASGIWRSSKWSAALKGSLGLSGL